VGKTQKRREFMVDLSLLGGLNIASADSAGNPSLRWRGRGAARMSEALALKWSAPATNCVVDKVGQGLNEGAHRGQELAPTAVERGAPLVGAACKRGESAPEMTRERGGKLAAEAKSEARRLARH
jgi:hypothetical protein